MAINGSNTIESDYFALTTKRREVLASHRKAFSKYKAIRVEFMNKVNLIRTTAPTLTLRIQSLKGERDKLEKQMIENRNHALNILKEFCGYDEQLRQYELEHNINIKKETSSSSNPQDPTVPDSDFGDPQVGIGDDEPTCGSMSCGTGGPLPTPEESQRKSEIAQIVEKQKAFAEKQFQGNPLAALMEDSNSVYDE